jgi:hypothetical protein
MPLLSGARYAFCDFITLGSSESIICGGCRSFFVNPSVWKVCGIAQPLAALPPYGCGMPLAGTQSTSALFKPCPGKKSLAECSRCNCAVLPYFLFFHYSKLFSGIQYNCAKKLLKGRMPPCAAGKPPSCSC